MSRPTNEDLIMEQLDRIEQMLLALTERAMEKELEAAEARATKAHMYTEGDDEVHEQINQDVRKRIESIKAKWGR